jgi:hypothetical protein
VNLPAHRVSSLSANYRIEGEIRAALAAAGIQIETDQSGPYGIVCFDKADDQLFSLLHEVRHDPRRRVLAVAANPHAVLPGTIWRLLHAGASDALLWNGNGGTAAQVAARLQRWAEVDELVGQAVSQEFIIGESPAWQAVVRKVVEAARFSTIPVLLTGESGTGKELLAKLISVVCASAGGSNKLRKDLITVDCASLVPERSGSEFFGHVRGAFTGAHISAKALSRWLTAQRCFLTKSGKVRTASRHSCYVRSRKRVTSAWAATSGKKRTFVWSVQPTAICRMQCIVANFAWIFITVSPAASFARRLWPSAKTISCYWPEPGRTEGMARSRPS